MGWVRLDDNLHDHPKFLELEDLGAIGLWTLCRTWAARHPRTIDGRRTAGVVTPGTVRRFAGAGGVDLARQLVAADLWSPVDGGWEIHDARDYEPAAGVTTPEDISSVRSAAGRKGAASRWAHGKRDSKPDGSHRQEDAESVALSLNPTQVSPDGETRPDPPPPSERREDVDRLCDHLADRIEGNGSKRPTIGKAWRDAARLMIDRDGLAEEKVHVAIDWVQDHEFWRSNVLSMPKLREQYDRLRLEAQRGQRAARGSTSDDRVAQALAAADEFVGNQRAIGGPS